MFGRSEFWPGAPVAVSVMLPMPDRVVIATRHQGLAGGRARGRGVKAVVPDTARRQFLERGCVARSAKGAGRAKARVVNQNDQDIGCACRRPHFFDGRILGIRVETAVTLADQYIKTTALPAAAVQLMDFRACALVHLVTQEQLANLPDVPADGTVGRDDVLVAAS